MLPLFLFFKPFFEKTKPFLFIKMNHIKCATFDTFKFQIVLHCTEKIGTIKKETVYEGELCHD